VATPNDLSDEQADLPEIDDYLLGSCDETPPVVAWSGDDFTPDNPDQLLKLTIEHAAAGVCVVVVDGELDILTVPLLENCLRDQLATTPQHLIIDLRPVRFLGSTGLTCLLWARQLVQQIPGTHLHLSGLINRVVRRALDITGLRGLFDTYLTLTYTRAVLAQTMGSLTTDPPAAPCARPLGDPTNYPPASASGNVTTPAVLAAVWCRLAGLTWTLELREVTPDDQFGALVDSISSDVSVSQPAPDALVQELVAPRGLWLFCQWPPGSPTSDRYHFGYVSIDTEL